MSKLTDIRNQVQDPEEAWEIDFTEAEGGAFFRSRRASHPFTPRTAEEIPAGALESLQEACGALTLSQVFVIPWAVRSTGYLGKKVITPQSVLALGDRAVGLWTEKPLPGVKRAIPLEKVAAIEDVIVLLYGRLSFIAEDGRLTVRYNTVARDEMEPALLEVRRRLAGPAQVVPLAESSAPELPFKWNGWLRRPLARLEETAPAAWSFASVPGRTRREAKQGQLLVLNPFEMVYLCDPTESTERYGVDSHVVPRSRITGVQVQEDNLAVSANGAHMMLPMALPLREAAVQWWVHDSA